MKKNQISQIVLALALSASITACGTRIDSVSDTLKYAVLGTPSVTLTQQQIDERAYPLTYIHFEGQPRVVVGLAFNDQGLYKWISQSQEVLVTHHGRVVQTQGLTRDIEWVGNITSDPLACLTNGGKDCARTWHSQIQTGNGFNPSLSRITSTFKSSGPTTIALTHQNDLDVTHWVETVTTDKGMSWDNHYWLEISTNRVVKSEQQLAHDFPKIETEEIKPYSKDLERGAAK